jgi:hypothetical protein
LSIKNNPSIKNDETVNINRSAIEHRATWGGLAFQAANEAGADGEQILRAAVAKTGCMHGALINDKVKKPVKLNEFADAFLSPVAVKTFEMEFITKNADTVDIAFHYCPLVAGWVKAGISEKDIRTLCDIAMDGDRKIASTAGVGFHLGKTIASGDSICEVTFGKKPAKKK